MAMVFRAPAFVAIKSGGDLPQAQQTGATAMTRANFECPARRKTITGHVGKSLAAVAAVIALAGCEQKNTFVPPPPPKVDVATPVQRTITRYLEATGNTAPIKNVD